MKRTEGDPHMPGGSGGSGAQDIAMNRHADGWCRTADVVIVNPTHYAVALKWDAAARAARRSAWPRAWTKSPPASASGA
ncbi:MAG: EscU/YscU/HrcU family type III secretion system export apparatus switch protein [Gemmobacter sp.]|nr:EscU/YscU/HrcU family type III secretion system export apparatus switch protein [Gemmobacter sp.]